MKGLSPTQRTLQALRNRGMLSGIVERWNQFAGKHGIRQDLFGFVDVIALDPERPAILGVQCCGKTGFAEHRERIVVDCHDAAYQWLLCGGAIEVWAWRKVKVKRGGKAMRWEPRVEVITLETLETLRGGEDATDEG